MKMGILYQGNEKTKSIFLPIVNLISRRFNEIYKTRQDLRYIFFTPHLISHLTNGFLNGRKFPWGSLTYDVQHLVGSYAKM